MSSIHQMDDRLTEREQEREQELADDFAQDAGWDQIEYELREDKRRSPKPFLTDEEFEFFESLEIDLNLEELKAEEDETGQE
jgi:hypothetical protein